MIDITLLRCLKTRSTYDSIRGVVPMKSMDQNTQTIIGFIDKYYAECKDADVLDIPTFDNLITHNYSRGHTDEELTLIHSIVLRSLSQDPSADAKHLIVNNLLELGYATELGNLLSKYNNGDEIDLISTISTMQEGVEDRMSRKTNEGWIKTSFADIVAEQEITAGLTYRLPQLNKAMRPLIAGDFGIWAARPDVGKTALLISEITHMATQLPEDRPCVILNNESLGERILARCVQSTLNLPMSKLVAMQKNGEDVYEMYDAALGGKDKIRIKDIHDWFSNEVEDYLKQQNPGLIVMDMIDNINFTGMNTNARTDEVLEHMYQWARKLGVKFGCPVMATSQISVEGEGLQFPLQSMLKDSKTGKQGAADYIIMMGTYADDKQSAPNRRYIGTPKNKLYKEGMNDPQFETYLKADTSRIEAR